MLGFEKPCVANALSPPPETCPCAASKGRQQKARYSGNSLKIDRGNALLIVGFATRLKAAQLFSMPLFEKVG